MSDLIAIGYPGRDDRAGRGRRGAVAGPRTSPSSRMRSRSSSVTPKASSTFTPAITRWKTARRGGCSGDCCSARCSSSRSWGWPSARAWARSWARSPRPGIDNDFQDQARDMLQPGTSALFLMVDKVTPGQGGRRAEPVRRHRSQVFSQRGRREGTQGRPARWLTGADMPTSATPDRARPFPTPPQAGRADVSPAWNDDDAQGGVGGTQREVNVAFHSACLATVRSAHHVLLCPNMAGLGSPIFAVPGRVIITRAG